MKRHADYWVKTSFNMKNSIREMLRWLANRNERSMTKHVAFMIIRDYRKEYDEYEQEEG